MFDCGSGVWELVSTTVHVQSCVHVQSVSVVLILHITNNNPIYQNSLLKEGILYIELI